MGCEFDTITYMNNAKEALMHQTTTIIIGNNAGAKFDGAGSLRMARAAAKGRRFVLKFVNNGVTVFTVWNAEGQMVGSY